MVYGPRQVDNIVMCDQPQLYVTENFSLPSRITFSTPSAFYNGEYKDNLSLFLLELWRQTVITNVDCAVELGNNAVRLVDDNFTDVELKKNDKLSHFNWSSN